MKTRRISLVALSAAAVLGVTACGSDTGSAAETTSAGESSSQSPSETGSTGGSSSSESSSGTSSSTGGDTASGAASAENLDEVIATAEDEAGGTAYEIDDQDDDGAWEVDVADGSKSTEVTVSADGSTVEDTDDSDDLDDEDRRGLEAAEITVGEAVDAALQEADGAFDDAELEEAGDSFRWEVSIDDGQDEVEVHVDVTSGQATVADDGSDDQDDDNDGS